MNQTVLKSLEDKRRTLCLQMQSLGDFRPGHISTNFRKCGKQKCACVQEGHSGHGPQYLLTVTHHGKTRSENLHLGPELEKARRETNAYRQFVHQCEQLVDLNEQICREISAPEVTQEEEMEALKKEITEDVLREAKEEIHLLIDRFLRDQQRIGSLDFEAMEMAIRHSMQEVGGVFLEKLLNADSGVHRGARIPCGSGHEASFLDYREKKVATALSPVTIQRAYYYCSDCQKGFIPKDQALDIEGTPWSPSVRRVMARVGAKESFDRGRQTFGCETNFWAEIDSPIFLLYYLNYCSNSDRKLMNQTVLKSLEDKRRTLYLQIEALGGFRPGRISTNFRKCGKQKCACVQEGHAGHGPQYLLTVTRHGKTRSENLHLGSELEKARRETNAYRQFVHQCEHLVDLNEQICRVRSALEITHEEELLENRK